MGRRGPKAKGPYSDKSAVFSTRLRADTKRDLVAAAKKADRNLSQEIEHRLRRSFDEETGIIERLGGEQLYALLRTISEAMQTAGAWAYEDAHRKKAAARDWLHDPYAYDMAVSAIMTVLEVFRPPGEIEPPVFGPEDIRGNVDKERFAAARTLAAEEVGRSLALGWLATITTQAPGQPVPSDRLTKSLELARRIGDGLKELRERAAPIVRARRTIKVSEIDAFEEAIDKYLEHRAKRKGAKP